MKWGRICAGAAILALTLLTFASCGPLNFKGHHLLLNSISEGDVTGGMSDMMGGMVPDAKPKSKPKSEESKTIFEGGDRWMHFLYIGILAVAVLALLVPVRLYMGVGVLGLLMTIVFMFSFNGWFSRQGDKGGGGGDNPISQSMSSALSLSWEMGAWITLAAFAGLAVIGHQSRGKGRGKGGDS